MYRIEEKKRITGKAFGLGIITPWRKLLTLGKCQSGNFTKTKKFVLL